MPRPTCVIDPPGFGLRSSRDRSSIDRLALARSFARREPASIRLSTTPVFLPANEVFSEAELDARIAWHAERVAAILVGESELLTLCWACGAIGPYPSRAWHRTGWVMRSHLSGSGALNEIYCPGCFAEWGWPTEIES